MCRGRSIASSRYRLRPAAGRQRARSPRASPAGRACAGPARAGLPHRNPTRRGRHVLRRESLGDTVGPADRAAATSLGARAPEIQIHRIVGNANAIVCHGGRERHRSIALRESANAIVCRGGRARYRSLGFMVSVHVIVCQGARLISVIPEMKVRLQDANAVSLHIKETGVDASVYSTPSSKL